MDNHQLNLEFFSNSHKTKGVDDDAMDSSRVSEMGTSEMGTSEMYGES